MVRNFHFLFLVFWVFSCTSDKELETQAYPILRTLNVTNINPDGATLNGEILNQGDEEILSYGFVFDIDDPDIDNSDTIIISKIAKEMAFSVTLDDAFAANLTYKVRFFAITTNHVVYGNTVEFQSKGSKWNPWIFKSKHEIDNTASELLSASNNENAFLVTSYGYFNFYDAENDNVISLEEVPDKEVCCIYVHNYACYYKGNYFYNLDLTDKTFLRYDRAQNKWDDLGTSMPVLSNRKYGFVIDETGYFISTGKLYIFDEVNNSWISKTALSETNIIYSVLVSGQNVYVFTDNQEIWKYTPSSDSWLKETEFPGIWKGNIIGFTVKNKLYYGLSYKPTHLSSDPVISPSEDFWEYTIETRTWERMKDFPLEHSKLGVVNFSIQDVGYLGFYDYGLGKLLLYQFDPDKVKS
jgi:hypothetical protein